LQDRISIKERLTVRTNVRAMLRHSAWMVCALVLGFALIALFIPWRLFGEHPIFEFNNSVIFPPCMTIVLWAITFVVVSPTSIRRNPRVAFRRALLIFCFVAAVECFVLCAKAGGGGIVYAWKSDDSAWSKNRSSELFAVQRTEHTAFVFLAYFPGDISFAMRNGYMSRPGEFRMTLFAFSSRLPNPPLLPNQATLVVGFETPFWFPVLGLMVYPFIIFLCGPVKKWRRRRRGRCVKCAYDLTGNVSGVCPECGTKIGEREITQPSR